MKRTFNSFIAAITIFISSTVIADGSIGYKINHYSNISQHFLGDDNKNNLYKIDLNYVDRYLPELNKLKRKDLKLIGKRILPGKSVIRLARYFAYNKKEYAKMSSPKDFFAALHDEHPHTYVITHDRLIFTETTATPQQEKNKDRLSKHYFISNLPNQVNYAGEFVPYKNPKNGDLFLVFDNGSGSYRPGAQYLPNLKYLLEENFDTISGNDEDKKVYFVIKRYDQKIDRAKLFDFQSDPFITST